MKKAIPFLLGFLMMLSQFTDIVHAAHNNSVYTQMSSDVTVNTNKILIEETVYIPSSGYVLVMSNGRYFPWGGSKAQVELWVDSSWAGTPAPIEWANIKVQHSFRCIGLPYLNKGYHTFRLKAVHYDGDYKVGAGTNLSVMVNPAPSAQIAWSSSQSSVFDFDTNNYINGTEPPSSTHLALSTSNQNVQEAIVIAAGSSEYHDAEGDAMWGIYRNNSYDGYETANWTVNDIYSGAEWKAPMSAVGYFENLSPGSHLFEWRASEFPWDHSHPLPEQLLTYRINAHSAMIVLSGNMDVIGGAVANEYPDPDDDPFNQWDYQVIGSSVYPQLPPAYQANEMASATFTIPAGHNGIVMFLATMRVQGDLEDQGGNVLLWLEIDGSTVGNHGVQQLTHPSCVSQRTLMAGYLSSENPLAVGSHTVKVYAKANGSFKHVSAHKELMLVYFD